jgi:plasmid stabilization system protein ParE
MTKPLTVSEAAETDIEAAVEWYDTRAPGLGNALIAQVNSIYENIREFPDMHQVAFANVRKAPVDHFPYAVVYRALPTVIEVIGVFPCRADPKRLARRATATGVIQ